MGARTAQLPAGPSDDRTSSENALNVLSFPLSVLFTDEGWEFQGLFQGLRIVVPPPNDDAVLR